jgi:hypothetical protein
MDESRRQRCFKFALGCRVVLVAQC